MKFSVVFREWFTKSHTSLQYIWTLINYSGRAEDSKYTKPTKLGFWSNAITLTSAIQHTLLPELNLDYG